MTKVPKGRRKRAYRPKTNSGCLTCRVRRIKCDETQPACLRCTSTGRGCDGYTHATTNALMLHSSSSSPSSPVSCSPSYDTYASWQSNRSFAFFLQWTCPQLAGFFGSDFWEHFTLQAAYHEPAVRYAIVAIGSLHELSGSPIPLADADKAFPLEQYSLAIRSLLVRSSAATSGDGSVDVDLCLMLCILFTCFENMQGHHAAAMVHVRSGVKLLNEIEYDHRSGRFQHKTLGTKSSFDCYVSPNALAELYARLYPHFSTMIGGSKSKLYEDLLSEAPQEFIPTTITSVAQAKEFFEIGSHVVAARRRARASTAEHYNWIPDPSPPITRADTSYFMVLLDRYNNALEEFITFNQQNFTPKEEVAMAVLQLHVHHAYLSISLEGFLPHEYPFPRWNVGDEFMPRIVEMLALAEKVMASASNTNYHGEQNTAFCLDMGLVVPLFNVATQCKDPILRRRAIALLRQRDRQEGLWNSFYIADAAERIVEIEEAGALFGVHYQPIFILDERGGRLTYKTFGDGGIDGLVDVTEEVFTWQ